MKPIKCFRIFISDIKGSLYICENENNDLFYIIVPDVGLFEKKYKAIKKYYTREDYVVVVYERSLSDIFKFYKEIKIEPCTEKIIMNRVAIGVHPGVKNK